jgi:hypothetical protein
MGLRPDKETKIMVVASVEEGKYLNANATCHRSRNEKE